MNEDKIKQLHKAFERIFALPVSRSTFRQLQNALFAHAEGNKDLVNALFQSLLACEIKGEGLNANDAALKQFIEQFSSYTSVAKEVFENGEFINLISSDLLDQQQRILFSNTVRRVDGNELQFITDFQSTLQLLHHFIARLNDAQGHESTKAAIQTHKKDLLVLKNNLKRIIGDG